VRSLPGKAGEKYAAGTCAGIYSVGPCLRPVKGRNAGSIFRDFKQALRRKTVMERQPEKKPMEKARELSQFTAAKTDPLGSWTGRPLYPESVPVQDADDL